MVNMNAFNELKKLMEEKKVLMMGEYYIPEEVFFKFAKTLEGELQKLALEMVKRNERDSEAYGLLAVLNTENETLLKRLEDAAALNSQLKEELQKAQQR